VAVSRRLRRTNESPVATALPRLASGESPNQLPPSPPPHTGVASGDTSCPMWLVSLYLFADREPSPTRLNTNSYDTSATLDAIIKQMLTERT
jgi:hypothetical protein